MNTQPSVTGTHFTHDELFKKALENPVIAREFFDSHLPSSIKAIVKAFEVWYVVASCSPTRVGIAASRLVPNINCFDYIVDISNLEMDKESFIEESLKKSISDILFKVKFNNENGYIFLLLEHQSRPDPLMAFRLFKYMLNILSRYITLHPKEKKLPLIYPMIFYNGKQNYNTPRNLWSLFSNPPYAKEIWTNDYQLINVREIPDEELKKKTWAGTLQFFMKHVFARDMSRLWKEMNQSLLRIIKVENGDDFIKILIGYTFD